MKNEYELRVLDKMIRSVKTAIEKGSAITMLEVFQGKSRFGTKIESKYRDFLDGIGKDPQLDTADPMVRCMVCRIELERYINEYFADEIHIYLRDNYGELEAYIMHRLYSPLYGYDMVCCKIDTLYQEIVRIGKIKESDFLNICKYKPPKSRKRSH